MLTIIGMRTHRQIIRKLNFKKYIKKINIYVRSFIPNISNLILVSVTAYIIIITHINNCCIKKNKKKSLNALYCWYLLNFN